MNDDCNLLEQLTHLSRQHGELLTIIGNILEVQAAQQSRLEALECRIDEMLTGWQNLAAREDKVLAAIEKLSRQMADTSTAIDRRITALEEQDRWPEYPTAYDNDF